MARQKNGILGGFSGKIGPIVGYQVNDDYFTRVKPRPRTRFTEKELANQAKFKAVQQFLEPIKDLLKVGYHQYFTKTGGYRAAVSYLRKHAVASDDAGHHIDPALARISGGELPQAVDPAMSSPATGELLISWDTRNVDYLNEADQLMVLLYDIKNSFAQMKILNGAFRRDGSLTIAIKHQIKRVEVDVYIAFVAADRSSQSNSQYMGKISVA